MTLGSALKVLQRRWLVILLGLLLTLGAAGYLYVNTPPRYQATARMLLLLPADSRGEEAIGSPFLYLPNGLNVLARIVSVSPTSREFKSRMVAQGLVSQYEVGVDTASPTLTVSVEGDDPANVIATRDGVITAVQDALLQIQQEENAPRQQTAHTRVYAAETVPDRISGDAMRGVIAVLAAGGLLTLLAAFVVDRLAHLRRARRDRRAANPKPGKAGAGATPNPPEPLDSADADAGPLALATQVQDAAYLGDEPEPGTEAADTTDADETARPDRATELEEGEDAAAPASPDLSEPAGADQPRRAAGETPDAADAVEAPHERSDVPR